MTGRRIHERVQPAGVGFRVVVEKSSPWRVTTLNGAIISRGKPQVLVQWQQGDFRKCAARPINRAICRSVIHKQSFEIPECLPAQRSETGGQMFSSVPVQNDDGALDR